MKQEDKQFLADLAHELNTQDNCGTKNPIWCMMDKHYVVTEKGYGNEYRVICDENDYSLCGFAMNVCDDWELKEEGNTLLLDEIESCTTTDELEDILEEYCVDYRRGSVTLYEATLEDYICPDATGFLTKKSAEEHLKANAHHYSPYARPYALSAWRNPIYERLINIIKDTKWEEEI